MAAGAWPASTSQPLPRLSTDPMITGRGGFPSTCQVESSTDVRSSRSPPQTSAPRSPPQTSAPLSPPQTSAPRGPPQTSAPRSPPQTFPAPSRSSTDGR
ncbi:hypothetical protein FQA47_018249 [Oryzias melastigma]|uniref:Uncharacterized protein n=1 Tax=Oryzias melastigma TaxID=30732 RepID=A0A834FRT1_ORYME|nr:hypothetical protein FQA47_018249 [Oryzias melastigma]